MDRPLKATTSKKMKKKQALGGQQHLACCCSSELNQLAVIPSTCWFFGRHVVNTVAPNAMLQVCKKVTMQRRGRLAEGVFVLSFLFSEVMRQQGTKNTYLH